MDPQLFTNQAIIAVIASWAIQQLKRSPRVTGFSQESSMIVQRYVAGMVAFATSLGIHFQFDHTAGTLLITGLSLASLGHFIWGAVQQFIMQEIAYQKVIKPTPPPQIPFAATTMASGAMGTKVGG